MVTLSKRATPSQHRILRIVEGAVLNEADVHGRRRDEFMARSIAKRAAGTLSAQWPEVLAVNSRLPAKWPVAVVTCRTCERRAYLAMRAVKQQRTTLGAPKAERGLSQLLRRPPLVTLWNEIKRELWQMKHDGDPRAATYIEFLKMIDKLQRKIAVNQPQTEGGK